MPQQIQLTIHVNNYGSEFQQQITTDLANLRHMLRGIEDGSFADKANLGSPDAVLSLQISQPNISSGYAVTAACNRCFLDITRDVISFIDRIITAKRLAGRLNKRSTDSLFTQPKTPTLS